MPLVITDDTVWSAGSVIDLTDDVHIAEGVTLTVEDGVTINGHNRSIQVWGSFIAGADGGADTEINSAWLTFGGQDSAGYFGLTDVTYNQGGFLYPTGNGAYGHFDVIATEFTRTAGFHIWYPEADSTFDRCIFNGTNTVDIGVAAESHVTISNSAFLNTQWAAVSSWQSGYDPSRIQLIGNSFYSLDRPALAVEEGYAGAGLLAIGNYFGTVDPSKIGERVLDRNDSLNRATIIDVSSPLSEPTASTPIVYDKLNGIGYGNASANQLVGSQEGDTLFGFSGDDKLGGGAGSDGLFGHNGSDTLAGGRGNDRLSGGEGADIFQFGAKAGRDTISDFDVAIDIIDLSAVQAIKSHDDLFNNHVAQHKNGVWIDLGRGARLIIDDLTMGELLPEHFLV